MRCPKCSYITFDSGERCRNCGYEFSFTQAASPDLPIQTGDEPEGPFADFALDLDDTASASPASSSAATSLPDPAPVRPITSSFDLPLFGSPHDDRPLVSAPAVPRAPLSVRKAAPIVQRQAPRRGVDEAPRLDLLLPEEPESIEPARAAAPAFSTPQAEVAVVEGTQTTASAGARAAAAVIDALLLGAINLAVLHFTLRLCGLTYADIAVIPPAPFLAFLLLLNGGYATAFTAAGGQSIGKMVSHIKVVPSDVDAWSDRVPLGQAVLRAAGYLISALPLGLGFLPALVGAEKRAVHDRLAHTRVVKA
jgi:uncharacterized RDD family membrane protein YckC